MRFLASVLTASAAALLLLSGCSTARLPLANQPQVVERASEWHMVDAEGSRSVGIDSQGYLEGCERLACEKEEDPCRVRHKTMLFLGVTKTGDEYAASIGLGYEYCITEQIAVAAFIDFAAGGLRETAMGAGLVFHPTEKTFFIVAPGIDVSKEGPTRALLRLGTGYDFELRRDWVVAPAVYLDLLEDGELAIVFGIEIGKVWR